jgi:acyl-CoA reductase-like NAD-dependent aldehyde dehydrogenase
MMEKPMDSNYKLLIDGKMVDGKEEKTFDTYCPANGEYLSTCVEAGREDIDLAVKAAWKAFDSWKAISPKERSRILLEIADRIDASTEKLAMIETIDSGKPIRESIPSIASGADHFRYFAAVSRTDESSAVMLDDETLSIVLREPIGVVGQIVPWNFPFSMSTWKIAPALAAGDTIVIKPSSAAPLSVLEFAKIMQDVLPKGVVNVLTGRGSVAGKYMLEHQGFRKLAFTGSTGVGYNVARAAADKLIPATLELGGKSANIFFPDAPWDKAIEGVQMGILRNQGQVCTSGSRVFVHEDIYDKFLAECVEKFNKIKVGLPWEKETVMSCQIHEGQLQKILKYVEIGKDEGAKVACGGTRITDGALGKGAFMRPTILSDVTNDMRVAQEEIFGPVACFIKFKNEDEVIKMANDSEYGLSGAVWTRDINRALKVARGIETGRMWINGFNGNPVHAPFGGYKKSGIGREAHKTMLDHYTQKKSILIHMSESKMGMY